MRLRPGIRHNRSYQQIPSGYSSLTQFPTVKRRRNSVLTCSLVYWVWHTSKGTCTRWWAVSDKSTNGSLLRAVCTALNTLWMVPNKSDISGNSAALIEKARVRVFSALIPWFRWSARRQAHGSVPWALGSAPGTAWPCETPVLAVWTETCGSSTPGCQSPWRSFR